MKNKVCIIVFMQNNTVVREKSGSNKKKTIYDGRRFYRWLLFALVFWWRKAWSNEKQNLFHSPRTQNENETKNYFSVVFNTEDGESKFIWSRWWQILFTLVSSVFCRHQRQGRVSPMTNVPWKSLKHFVLQRIKKDTKIFSPLADQHFNQFRLVPNETKPFFNQFKLKILFHFLHWQDQLRKYGK